MEIIANHADSQGILQNTQSHISGYWQSEDIQLTAAPVGLPLLAGARQPDGSALCKMQSRRTHFAYVICTARTLLHNKAALIHLD